MSLRSIVLLGVLMVGACRSFQPLPADRVSPDDRIRLGFEQPEPLWFVTPSNDSVAFSVVALEGWVLRVEGDTLDLTIADARDVEGRSLTMLAGSTTRVLGPRAHQVRTERVSAVRTVGLGLGVGAVVFVALVALLLSVASPGFPGY